MHFNRLVCIRNILVNYLDDDDDDDDDDQYAINTFDISAFCVLYSG